MYDNIKLTTIYKPIKGKDYLIIDNQAMIFQLLDKLYDINENIKIKGSKHETI
jgi:hypothetical protein